MPSALSRAARTFLLFLAAGFALLLVVGLADRRGFQLDVASKSQVLLRPGQQLCRDTIRPPGAGADHVRFWARPVAGPLAPPIAVEVRRGRVAQTLADGRAELGPAGARTVRLRGSVAGSRKVVACFVNVGAGAAVLSPRPGTPTRSTLERFGGASEYADIGLELVRSDDPSVLGGLPDAFARAARFRPGWVGAWTYWLALVALAVGVPALLARALSDVAAEDESADTSASS